jgi:hypothetical protein
VPPGSRAVAKLRVNGRRRDDVGLGLDVLVRFMGDARRRNQARPIALDHAEAAGRSSRTLVCTCRLSPKTWRLAAASERFATVGYPGVDRADALVHRVAGATNCLETDGIVSRCVGLVRFAARLVRGQTPLCRGNQQSQELPRRSHSRGCAPGCGGAHRAARELQSHQGQHRSSR